MDRAELAPGQPAPDFTLPDQDGSLVSLAHFRGRRVVVYFYPKDDSPGCTAEACQFNNSLPAFSGPGIDVVGISADDAASHVAFRARHGLGFSLLSDPQHQVMQAYGVWGENTRPDGTPYTGTIRSTFLIGTGGEVERAWYNVGADGHALEALAELHRV